MQVLGNRNKTSGKQQEEKLGNLAHNNQPAPPSPPLCHLATKSKPTRDYVIHCSVWSDGPHRTSLCAQFLYGSSLSSIRPKSQWSDAPSSAWYDAL